MVALIIVFFTVGFDQLTKYYAITKLEPIGTYPIIEGIFHFTYTTNKGAAFGILTNHRWVFLALSTISILVLAYILIRFKRGSPIFMASLALMLGGGIGNMIDRVSRGYVIDFLEFRFINFAIFNVADSCVCIGGVVMCVYMIVAEFRGKDVFTNTSKIRDQVPAGKRDEADEVDDSALLK